jgi:hypothetical protein
MKAAFALFLIALMIFPALAVIRVRLARGRRAMPAEAKPPEGED